MTRQEFTDDIQDWGDLINTANDEDYDLGIAEPDDIRDRIQDMANDIRYGTDWESFATWVSNIPQGYQIYSYYEEYDEYTGLTDTDFERYKEDFRDFMEENDLFDDDEEEYEPEEECEGEYEPEEDEELDEGFTVGELVQACFVDITINVQLKKENRENQQREFDTAFAKLSEI